MYRRIGMCEEAKCKLAGRHFIFHSLREHESKLLRSRFFLHLAGSFLILFDLQLFTRCTRTLYVKFGALRKFSLRTHLSCEARRHPIRQSIPSVDCRASPSEVAWFRSRRDTRAGNLARLRWPSPGSADRSWRDSRLE